MIDNEIIQLLIKLENAIILCYDIETKKIIYSYYGENNLCENGPITMDEFAEILNKIIDVVVDKDKLQDTISTILKEKEIFNFPEVYINSEEKPIKVHFKGGKIDNKCIIVHIVREKVQESEESFDELTKCVSIDLFKNKINKEIKANQSFISGIIDIDNFKDFNFKYNHVLGDIVLIEAASIIKEICATNGLVCRYGGDSFLFYYKIDNDYDIVYKFITDAKRKIEEFINKIINTKDKITVTIGLSRFPLDGDNYDILINKNKAALFRGKRKARNCFIIYLVEKCGYVDEKTFFDKRIETLTSSTSNISVLTGVLEFLNAEMSLRKRIEDSISLIGNYFYLDRIIVTITDPKTLLIDDLIVWYNPRSAKKEYKYSSKNIKYWKLIYEKSNLLIVNDAENNDAEAIDEILKESNISACVAIEMRQDGRLFGQIRFEMTSISRNWQANDVSSFVLIAKMLSVKMNKEYTLQNHYKEMYFDRTTDIFNLQKWNEEAEIYIKAHKNLIYSILDVSIYDYVNILNIFGVLVVEKILKTIANYLKTLLGRDIIFARTAENRFSLFFPGKDLDEINQVYQGLKDYVKKNVKLEKGDVILQGGIYINEENVSLLDSLDRAVIARKFEKKFDDAILFSNTMYEKETFRLELESHLEKALEDNEFLLYLQPKISTKDKTLAGAEALTRWNYNFEKLIFPNDFIPLLEKNGYISRLDFNVFENVCKFHKKLIDGGYKTFPISVNVSRSIDDFNYYLNELEKIRLKYNVPSELIEVEITEGMYTENNEKIKEFINNLHAKGYKVSLDDFGSGYSNISALSQLNFDTIKFDRSFLTDEQDEKNSMIIHVMTKLVKDLNMNVLCEGVETSEYEKFLTEIGCDYIQGYYYDKPLPLETFVKKYVKK